MKSWRRMTRIIYAVGWLLAFITRAGDAADWPQFRGPRGDGRSEETGLVRQWPESGPSAPWSVPLAEGFGGAAVREGRVYVLDRVFGEQDVVRCLDLNNGKELWNHPYAAPGRLRFPGARSVPAVDDAQVYTIGGFGHVSCLNRETGKPVWRVDLKQRYETIPPKFGYTQSPLPYKEWIIVAPLSDQAGLAALDRQTGEEIWRTQGLGSSHSTPALLTVHGRPQIVFTSSVAGRRGLVSGLDTDSGRLLWRFDQYYVRRDIPMPTVVGENRVFLTGGYGAGSVMLRVDTASDNYRAEELFRLANGSQIHPPVLFEGHLYLTLNENANLKKGKFQQGGLACLDLSGNIKWRTGDKPNFGRGGFILADDLLIVQDGFNGRLRLIEPIPDGYRQLAEANVFGVEDDQDHQMWGPPALSDGRLLMRGNNELKCVDLRAR